MRKVIACFCLLGLGVLFPGTSEAATRVRFFIGGSVQAAHFSSYQGYGFGGEVGIQVSDLLCLVADGATGTITQTYSYTSTYELSHETMKLTLTPFTFSVHFTAPLGDSFQPYVGVGIAHCDLELTDSYSYQYLGYSNGSDSKSKTWKLSAIAPIFKLGLVISLSQNIKIIGEYRQIVAKDKLTVEGSYSTSENDLYFGTADLKVGIRIVI